MQSYVFSFDIVVSAAATHNLFGPDFNLLLFDELNTRPLFLCVPALMMHMSTERVRSSRPPSEPARGAGSRSHPGCLTQTAARRVFVRRISYSNASRAVDCPLSSKRLATRPDALDTARRLLGAADRRPRKDAASAEPADINQEYDAAINGQGDIHDNRSVHRGPGRARRQQLRRKQHQPASKILAESV
jgi:hypothetical protein